jgi:hypothetical protein
MNIIANPFRSHVFRLGIAAALALSLAASALAGDGSLRHGFFMRGQILEVDKSGVVICVGKRDGAEVGQTLDVIRHKRKKTPPKSSLPQFDRIEVGKVRITEVFDDHYARAEVIDGKVRATDTVEIENP